MRIVGGSNRGRRLKAPSNENIRPTSDRIREALFNVLAHSTLPGFSLEGARVLDLFAGTGALGLEALSRGAAFTIFVEDDTEARGLIRDNGEALGAAGHSKIFKRDATRLGARMAGAGPAFNLVFVDPPYAKGLGEKALISARDGDWLVQGALCIVEEKSQVDFEMPDGFQLLNERRYGDTKILMLRYTGTRAE